MSNRVVTGYTVYIERTPHIANSADKHGIDRDDTLHAYRQTIKTFMIDTDFSMQIGPDRDGNWIEVGVLHTDSGAVIIHSMPARKRFLKE